MEDNRIHKRSKILHEPYHFNNLKEMINNSRKKYAKENAFTFKTDKPDIFTHITYEEYGNEIDSFGTALINAGLKGKRIAIISENRYEWMLSYLSIVCGVGVVSPLDKSLPEDELIHSVERSEVEAIIYSDKYEEIMKKIEKENLGKVKYFISMDKEKSQGNMYSLKELVQVGKELVASGDRRYIDSQINNEEMAVMLFTSRNNCNVKNCYAFS